MPLMQQQMVQPTLQQSLHRESPKKSKKAESCFQISSEPKYYDKSSAGSEIVWLQSSGAYLMNLIFMRE